MSFFGVGGGRCTSKNSMPVLNNLRTSTSCPYIFTVKNTLRNDATSKMGAKSLKLVEPLNVPLKSKD